jgi:hypothetical protein
MTPTNQEQSAPHTTGPEPAVDQVARAIRDLAIVAREEATSLRFVVHDGFAKLNDSVRSSVTAIVAAIKQPAASNTNAHWSDTDTRFAQAHGGRPVRPMSEKTDEEKANLERMRASKQKGQL